MLAAIGTTVIFNVMGTIIFVTALPIVYQFVLWLGSDVNIRMQIAYAHGLFNVTNTLIFLPLIPVLAWIVTKLVPGKMEEIECKPRFLDPRLLATPSVALGQAQHEILRMGVFAREVLSDASTYLFGKTKECKLSIAEGTVSDENSAE